MNMPAGRLAGARPAIVNAMDPAVPRAAYVHVPFCRHRCGYCDFSLVAGRDDLIERYFQALGRELARVPEPLCLDTLFVGGGTPSHLGVAGLRRLAAVLQDKLILVAGAEATLEANPSDVTPELVEVLREGGFSRLSLGAQSLAPATLAALDRDHTPDDVRRAVEAGLQAGLTVSVDLMIAAPGQSLAAVEQDLEDVLALGVQHVSVYCLTWEKGTRFASLLRQGLLQEAEEDLEREMYEVAIERLEGGGLEQYEVSNFARPGHRCRHNETYWDCRPWEGFGPGAARFDGRTRITNHRSPVTWMPRSLSGADPSGDCDQMTPEEAARERIVVGLRRRDGLVRGEFAAASGFSLDALAGGAILSWVEQGLASDDGQRVRLTRRGLLVSDGLWAEVLAKGA